MRLENNRLSRRVFGTLCRMPQYHQAVAAHESERVDLDGKAAAAVSADDRAAAAQQDLSAALRSFTRTMGKPAGKPASKPASKQFADGKGTLSLGDAFQAARRRAV